ncbi:hydroxymethylglutaryl-CoA lyase [Salipaludibacillus aurantiacus]|uniref:Hydroxymethylglutaryl-CoA lyase n=1 Tax=Salipaludibacillus aurantiacus TaxID=1601833 RepID=A0A1H9RRD7_9BACI|nr:hydroxymethylglutaryl-CoA lyase [Salipaludibacillus aurantiacus]SER74479.1 hydroxymethylglutaryl-CoA lyase [Salipaludibacillus aurantiacus]
MRLPEDVILKEVGPRDGLQNEKVFISTEDKVEWINQLSESGLSYIEVSSFVHPKWIPALSDADEVFSKITRQPGVTYSALVPNAKGTERALKANVDEFAVFMSASDTHNRKNINKSIEETFPVLEEVADEGRKAGKKVRGYVSTVFGCPYDGKVAVSEVKKVCDRLFSMGVYEISLGDTIGIANPKQVDEVLRELVNDFDADRFALHFHDTRGLALANTLAGLNAGITTFDGSTGGLGGCPYAKGASGNAASEDLIFMFEEMGINTGIDFNKFLKAASFIEKALGKPLPGRQLKLLEGRT